MERIIQYDKERSEASEDISPLDYYHPLRSAADGVAAEIGAGASSGERAPMPQGWGDAAFEPPLGGG